MSASRALVTAVILTMLLSSLAAPQVRSEGGQGPQEPLPQFRSSLNGTGAVAGGGPVNGSVLWRTDTDDPVLSSPTVHQGRVLVGTMGGEVMCLNAYSGNVLWAFETGGPVESSPTVAAGRVYVGSDDGNLYCLDLLNGELVWNTSTGGEVKSSPRVAEGRVFVGSNDFNVYCVDELDGEVLWTFKTGGWVYSSPALRDGQVHFGSCDGYIYSLNSTTGEETWRFHAAYAPASPAVTEDLVIIGAYDDRVHYIDRVTGEEVYNVSGMGSGIYSSPAVWAPEGADGELPAVYVTDNEGTLFMIDQYGEVYHREALVNGASSSPILALDLSHGMIVGPLLVFADHGGNLYGRELLWPHSGVFAVYDPPVNWSVNLGSFIQSSPFLYHGKAYVGVEMTDGTGAVACVGVLVEGTEGTIEVGRETFFVQEDGEYQVQGLVRGIVPNRVEVDVEGTTLEPGLFANGAFYLQVPSERRQGDREVVVRAYVNGEEVATERALVFVHVAGWNDFTVHIDRPGRGDRLSGVFTASGTARSNYTITSVLVYIDDDIANATRPEDLLNWSVVMDTHGLDDGVHTLSAYAEDEWSEVTTSLRFSVGEEEGGTSDVTAADAIAFLVLATVFVVLLLTKPPRQGGSSVP